MSVCIDCSPLLVRSSGVKTYLHELTRHLQAAYGRESVRTFPVMDDIGLLRHDQSPLGTAETVARLGILYMVNRGLVPPTLVMPRVDVFHASNLVRKLPRHCRVTSTIHDVTSWIMPQFHRAATLRADREAASRMWNRADGLIAVSETSRRDAAEVLGLDPGKITVVHNGVADAYFAVNADSITNVRSLYAIPTSYILFVSTIEPRKNLDRLVTAYEQLSRELRNAFQLLIVGPTGWNHHDTLHRIQNHPGGVRYLGYVPEEHMPALFAGATLSVYPSLYEGFGLPVLQSMAAGTPLIASSAGAVPEVAGDCAAYVDPYSIDEITAALRRLLLSPSERADLAARGRTRAAAFTWAECARKTWRFFESIG